MYAESKGKTFKQNITGENAEWQTIILKNIAVKNGRVEIGFTADGAANAFCYVDDVSLVKN